ncbi:MAG: ZIP family metal transporter [Candidatus Hadarchaeales archaeon]
MTELLWILLATFFVSLISLAGAVTLVLSEKMLRRLLLVLVGFSAGALIGGAFLHLLPETIEGVAEGQLINVFLVLISGFVLFFVMEKLLWRHCHERKCPIHTFAYLNLLGDGVHNFIDGLIIAASFIANFQLGLVATLAVAAHEVPQELGDFGVIVYGGIKPKKALSMNFLTALAAVAGGILGYWLNPHLGNLMIFLLPLAAGGFLYIAASDLVPELHKERERTRVVASFFAFILGIFLMWAIKYVLG